MFRRGSSEAAVVAQGRMASSRLSRPTMFIRLSFAACALTKASYDAAVSCSPCPTLCLLLLFLTVQLSFTSLFFGFSTSFSPLVAGSSVGCLPGSPAAEYERPALSAGTLILPRALLLLCRLRVDC